MTLYQTLEDRDNIDEVESCGPYPCKRRSAWMGIGYYFWDTFIDLAKWWGRVTYSASSYIVCKTVINFVEGELLDLEQPEVMLDFENVSRNVLPMLYPESNHETNHVRLVLDALRKRPEFKYKAVRLRGSDSINYDEELMKHRMQFPTANRHRPYLDLRPAIQVCIFDKSIIGKNNFKVVYPEKYVVGDDWVL